LEFVNPVFFKVRGKTLSHLLDIIITSWALLEEQHNDWMSIFYSRLSIISGPMRMTRQMREKGSVVKGGLMAEDKNKNLQHI